MGDADGKGGEEIMVNKRLLIGVVFLYLLMFCAFNIFADDYKSDFDIHTSQETYKLREKMPEAGRDQSEKLDESVQKKKTYSCYWRAEAFRTSIAITDGSYFGQHSTDKEAWEACKREAERTLRLGGFKMLSFECTCQ